MSNDERWFDFHYQFIATGWFSDDRDKTIEAMRRLSERMPEDVVDNLPLLTLFAPSAALLGLVLPFGTGGDKIFVYLSPQMESKSQAEVDFTVAHEFAHLALGHYKPGVTTTLLPPGAALPKKHEDWPDEQDADRLAESWGFKRPCRTARKRGAR